MYKKKVIVFGSPPEASIAEYFMKEASLKLGIEIIIQDEEAFNETVKTFCEKTGCSLLEVFDTVFMTSEKISRLKGEELQTLITKLEMPPPKPKKQKYKSWERPYKYHR